jgi:hypothetical protein
MKKLFVVGVIGLFLGLACAPSLNAGVSKESEQVEFTTEICGLNGGKQVVKLTQQQAIEVEELFDLIRERLNATESREEAEEIFKEAVVDLDKYGLLGGLSVKQAQRLVIGDYQNSKGEILLQEIYNKKLIVDNKSNFLCLLSGESDLTTIIGPITLGILFNMIFLFSRYVAISNFLWNVSYLLFERFGAERLWEIITSPLGSIGFISLMTRELFWLVTCYITNVFPFKIGSIITFGWPDINFVEPSGPPHPAEGELVTFGLAGKKVWNGEFFGDIFYYVGAIGFTGIKIIKELKDLSYIGSALWIKLDTKPIES